MRKASWLGVLVCVIGLSGCTVYSTRPLGLPVWSEMQGIWQVQDRFYEVRLLADGSLSMTWLRWDANEGRFGLGRGELVVAVDEGSTYANIRDFDDPEGIDRYSVYRVLFLRTSTTTSGPDIAPIGLDSGLLVRAVSDGILRGEETELGIVVDDPRLADFVDPLRFAEQFAIDDPDSTALARRIVKFSGPDIRTTVLHQGRQAHIECLRDSSPQWVGAHEYGVADVAQLSAADFSSYLTCLDSRGFGLVNVSNMQDDAVYGSFWVAKEGFGLFEFEICVE